MLTEGQAAPAFTVQDIEHQEISLESLRGSYSLVSFFRYAGCPFCSLSLIKLIERYGNFAERGLKVVSFFQSPDASISKYVSLNKPPFPIVGDADKTVYDAYQIQRSVAGAVRSIADVPEVLMASAAGTVKQGTIDGDFFLMPAQFIIGPDLKIMKAHYGNSFRDTISLLDIEEVLLTKVAPTV